MDTPDSDITDPLPELGERIAKRLARAGLCSRRDAERWIAEGRIAVNGAVLNSPAFVVRPGDIVLADGKPIPEPEPARLWRYHKPAGLVTSARDEKGRATVFDRLPPNLPRVVSIGRLDLTTEGLLLLTNDGELARFLEMPTTGWTRRYRVRVFGEVDPVALSNLQKGLTIDGIKYGPIEATLDRIQGRNAWLSVALKEGKNREIRRVMESMGLQVNRLIRVSYGPFQLGKLEEGAVEEVPKRVVREQIAPFFTGGTMSGDIDAPPSGKAGKSAKAAASKSAASKPSGATGAEPRPHVVESGGDRGRKADAGKKAAPVAKPGQSRAALERDDSFKSGEAKTGWAKADRSHKSGDARKAGPRNRDFDGGGASSFGKKPAEGKAAAGAARFERTDSRAEGRKGGFRTEGIRSDSPERGEPRRSSGGGFGKKAPAGRPDRDAGNREFGGGKPDRKPFGGKAGVGKPADRPRADGKPGGRFGGKPAGAGGGERGPRREGRPGADRRR